MIQHLRAYVLCLFTVLLVGALLSGCTENDTQSLFNSLVPGSGRNDLSNTKIVPLVGGLSTRMPIVTAWDAESFGRAKVFKRRDGGNATTLIYVRYIPESTSVAQRECDALRDMSSDFAIHLPVVYSGALFTQLRDYIQHIARGELYRPVFSDVPNPCVLLGHNGHMVHQRSRDADVADSEVAEMRVDIEISDDLHERNDGYDGTPTLAELRTDTTLENFEGWRWMPPNFIKGPRIDYRFSRARLRWHNRDAYGITGFFIAKSDGANQHQYIQTTVLCEVVGNQCVDAKDIFMFFENVQVSHATQD